MFAAIYVPSFALQASLRYEPALREQPVAIVDENEKPTRIVEFTRAARRAGIRAGMTSSQGLARCAGLQLRYRCAQQERIAADTLLQCAACSSPAIEATGPGICTVDLKGIPAPSHQPAAQGLLEQLRRQELIAKIGIASTPGLAFLAARNARPILHVASPRDLHALPISALAPTPALAHTLRGLGIRRLRDFCELPPEGIAARFGPEGLAHWQCIAGKTTRLLQLVNPPQLYEEAADFEAGIELLEPIIFMLRRFIERLADRLSMAWLVAAALHLRLGFTAGPEYVRAFPIPSPTCDVETLFRMLFTHLESFQSQHPIKSLRLTATPCKPLKEQLGLFQTSLRDPNQFHQTLARLSALVGVDRAGVPVNQNTFRPDSFTLQQPAFHEASVPAPSRTRGLALRRFRPPRPVHVFTVNQRPASIVMEDFSAPLGDSSGPWAASGEWWDHHAWDIAEWDVESADGRLCRLFQQGASWYLAGIYD